MRRSGVGGGFQVRTGRMMYVGEWIIHCQDPILLYLSGNDVRE